MIPKRRSVGDVLIVGLGDDTSTFAITLPKADFAFFDARNTSPNVPPDLLQRPILFRVAVHKSAWATGRWQKIAKFSVPEALQVPHPKFLQDAFNPEQFEIYLGGAIRPATRCECEGLERAAVWEPEHVEERLRSHYAGTESIWFQSLRAQ